MLFEPNPASHTLSQSNSPISEISPPIKIFKLTINFTMAEVNRKSTFSMGRGTSSLKEAIARREKGQYRKVHANKFEYMDSMQESLNKEIQSSVNPYWRNHASLKGKQIPDLPL